MISTLYILYYFLLIFFFGDGEIKLKETEEQLVSGRGQIQI